MFDHLKSLKVGSDSTAEYVFYEIHGEPTLVVKPAGEANAQYLNAVLKKSKNMLRRLRGGKMDVAALRESRGQDLDLYPKYIVVGWSEVMDSDGEPVEFSGENCRAFLEAIPPDMFDELRGFCGDLDNFRELSNDDIEELAGN